jgi:hypothetical protein
MAAEMSVEAATVVEEETPATVTAPVIATATTEAE